jgi:deazaflavin-dependent oxidoreductase (nitroreductase family)
MTDSTPTPAPILDRDAVRLALRTGGVIDITTTGRRSGEPRRIEIVFHHLDGRVWISGLPGPRAWLDNLRADPRLTFHLKGGIHADLAATARIVEDELTRRAMLTRITRSWRRESQLERFVADAPLIEVIFDDPTLLAD